MNFLTKTFVSTTSAVSGVAKRFSRDQRGVTAIEYSLIAMAMAALVMFVMKSDGTLVSALKTGFQSIGDAIIAFADDVGGKN